MINYGFEHMRHCEVAGCGLLCGPTTSAREAHRVVHGHLPKFAKLQGADGGQAERDPDDGAGQGRRAREPAVPEVRGTGAGDPPPDAAA